MANHSFLTFTLADHRLAIDTRLVIKSLRAIKISHVPHASSLVHGLTNYRGEVVTLLDLPYMLGFGKNSSTNNSRSAQNVIVLRTASETSLGGPAERVGFFVDQLDEFVQVDDEDISAADDDDNFYEHLIVIDGLVVKTLNIKTLFVDEFYADESTK